jgi:hypothetical protein
MFGFTLHAGNRYHFLFHKHVFVVFLSHFSTKKIKIGGVDVEFFFFFFFFFSIDSFSDIACVFA